MNIEGITLLNQFVEYSCKPFIVIMMIIIGAILILIGIELCESRHPAIGFLIAVVGALFVPIFAAIANKETHKNFLNYPAYTHYIIQIDDKAAWSEIAPNYIIVKEVYPNTGIYEIKREYKEGDE